MVGKGRAARKRARSGRRSAVSAAARAAELRRTAALVRARRRAGVVLLVTAVSAVLLAAAAVTRFPAARAAEDRYRSAAPCADGDRADCLITVRQRVVSVHAGRGRSDDDRITVGPPDGGAGPDADGRQEIHLAGDSLSGVHPGDPVLVTSWNGTPVTVTDADRTLSSSAWLPDRDVPLLLAVVVWLLALATVTGWGGVRRLHGLGRRSDGRAPTSLLALVALALTGSFGVDEASTAATGVAQGLVLLVSAAVVTRQEHRRRTYDRRTRELGRTTAATRSSTATAHD